jgi:hypothetical protein
LYEYNIEHLTKDLDLDTHLLDSELNADGEYIAPNGKSYNISYNTDKGYYSADMKSIKYFATLGQLKSYIQINNPDPAADISTRIIAPNGKRYNIIQNSK